MPVSHSLDDALDRVDRHSSFLRALVNRRPEVVVALRERGLAATLGGFREAEGDLKQTGVALRRERQATALAVALADLAGLAPLEEVVQHLSSFADHALDRAIRTAIEERTPGAEPIGFAALALGKHGSQELNYSSDIDPILIFDPDILPHRPREEPVEAAVRITRRVLELLQHRDGEGYVFRVDLRLRPSPEATPLALPFNAALSYYESSALPWERAAFIRARAAAGDRALGEQFLGNIRPFIWRRALDFGALREIRSISRRIRDHHAQGQMFGPGYDLKRGRGGIREVEFFAQIHQLIHGGRDPALRAPATLDAIAALSAAGQITADETETLASAYRLYRTIEHRLQMVDDLQTHRLPKQAEALLNVAQLHGLADSGELLDLLAPHVRRVGTLYDGLDGEPVSGLSRDGDLLSQALVAAGFQDPANSRLRIEKLREGKVRALRTPAAHEAFEAVLPALIKAFGAAPQPDEALNRFDDMVAQLPSVINLFRLLEARPALARALTDILCHAPTLAHALARRAELLDGLIDATAFALPPATPELIAQFGEREAGDDYQATLDRVRQKVGERRFALGTQIIEGVSDPLDVAAGYSRVAEAAFDVLAAATIAEFETQHGKVPGGELIVLALGRLGGGALTHASDLDIVYLFTGNHLAESDGRRPLGATTYFNRLAQRVSAALSVSTASGPLYEVDTRLRPSGTQGLLAVSVESFERYQRESAWTWEHMALTRARAIFGSADGRRAVQAIIDTVLHRPRDAEALLADAVKMRSDIRRHKPAAGPFDVKLIAGGLVDLEFALHVLQLSHHIGLVPQLPQATEAITQAGLIDSGIAEAQELLSRMLVTLRLVAPESGEPPVESRALVARACQQPDWDHLTIAYAAARTLIAQEWHRITGSDAAEI